MTSDDLEPRFAGTYEVTDDLNLTPHVRWFASCPALLDTWAAPACTPPGGDATMP